MKRKWLAIGIILLFVGIAYAPAIAQNSEKSQTSRGNWLYVGGSGPGNYSRIQDAIDNASDGDTIFVYNGTYHEHLEINKLIRLYGQNQYGAILDGGGAGNVVYIIADSVNIKGFTIRNGGSGVLIDAKYVVVRNNIIVNNSDYGIIEEPIHTVSLFTTISNNFITGNGDAGIFLNRDDCTIFNNIVSKNEKGIVLFIGAHDNSISSNTILDNDEGIVLWADANRLLSNVIVDNNIGIRLAYSNSNAIQNNTIINNGYGIILEYYEDKEEIAPSSNNKIIDNVISGHTYGIRIQRECNNNLISRNDINNNTYGFSLDTCNNTKIQQNNIIGNTRDVLFKTYWKYNITFTENYWDDLHNFNIKIIIGKKALFPRDSTPELFRFYWFFIPCLKFDIAPAQEPYDIPGVS